MFFIVLLAYCGVINDNNRPLNLPLSCEVSSKKVYFQIARISQYAVGFGRIPFRELGGSDKNQIDRDGRF